MWWYPFGGKEFKNSKGKIEVKFSLFSSSEESTLKYTLVGLLIFF